MPKWLLIKLFRTLVFAVHTGEKAVYIYREYVSPVVVVGAYTLAAKTVYDGWYETGIFAKNEEVEVDDNKRTGGKARRTDNSKAWFGGNCTP